MAARSSSISRMSHLAEANNSPMPALPSPWLRDLGSPGSQKERTKVVCRRAEISTLSMALSRGLSPLLTGGPGTGKSAVVQGLLEVLFSVTTGSETPAPSAAKTRLRAWRFWGVNLAEMCIRCDSKQQFVQAWTDLLAGVAAAPLDSTAKGSGSRRATHVVLVINNLEVLALADSPKNRWGEKGEADVTCQAPPSLLSLLLDAIEKRQIQVVTETTTEAFAMYMNHVPGIERILSQMRIKEPSQESAMAILQTKKWEIEEKYKVHVLDGALQSAVRLSDAFMTHRFMPEKCIDLLVETSARGALSSQTQGKDHNLAISREHVARVVNAWTRIPMATIVENENGGRKIAKSRSVAPPRERMAIASGLRTALPFVYSSIANGAGSRSGSPKGNTHDVRFSNPLSPAHATQSVAFRQVPSQDFALAGSMGPKPLQRFSSGLMPQRASSVKHLAAYNSAMRPSPSCHTFESAMETKPWKSAYSARRERQEFFSDHRHAWVQSKMDHQRNAYMDVGSDGGMSRAPETDGLLSTSAPVSAGLDARLHARKSMS